MKKVILLFTILLLVASQASSQSLIFQRTCAPIMYADTSWLYPVVCTAKLKNTSTTAQNFKIARIYVTFPAGWSSSICNGINCYPPDADTIPPRNGGNYTIGAGQTDSLISLDVYGSTHGLGIIILRAFIANNPAIFMQDTIKVQLRPPAGITPISSVVKDYDLKQNYPNPFNPTTSIDFSIQKNSEVNLIVYDMQGREVARLLNNEHLSQGSYKYDFNADDFHLSSGAYFYKLSTGDFVSTKKMLLIK